MSLLRNAIRDTLRPVVKATAGVSVRYHSFVTGDIYSVVATLDDAAGEVETTEGMTIPFHSGVFKIDRLDLPVAPDRRDRIEWIDPDDTTRVEWFMILSDGAVDAFAPNGNFRDVWRLNTKWIPNPDAELQSVYGNAGGIAYGNDDPSGVGYGSSRR